MCAFNLVTYNLYFVLMCTLCRNSYSVRIATSNIIPAVVRGTRDLSRDANLSAASFRGHGPPRIRLGDEVPPASLLFPAALRA